MNENEKKQITAIKVIGVDFDNELKDFCIALFYNNDDVIYREIFNISFRDFKMPLLLKELHTEFGILPEFEIKRNGDE